MSWFGYRLERRSRAQYLTTEQLVPTELPESIGKLTKLKKFNCKKNMLTSEFPRIFLAPPKPSTQY